VEAALLTLPALPQAQGGLMPALHRQDPLQDLVLTKELLYFWELLQLLALPLLLPSYQNVE
jgi:hypothetical protein